MVKGRILSVETMGLVDGPGIRVVVFMQGCGLRCSFCHNPDSWDFCGGEEVTSDELMKKILRFRPYFERSGGGVTFSGGEPLLQGEFLLEMLKRCRQENIHTCIDTAGVGNGDYDEILSYTDLVLYDVKAIDSESYKKLCGTDIEHTQRFQQALNRNNVKTIVRQVVVPGVNDNDEYMLKLKEYINKNISVAVGVELLPYHSLGAYKYKKLGIPYSMENVPDMDKDTTHQLWKKYLENF